MFEIIQIRSSYAGEKGIIENYGIKTDDADWPVRRLLERLTACPTEPFYRYLSSRKVRLVKHLLGHIDSRASFISVIFALS